MLKLSEPDSQQKLAQDYCNYEIANMYCWQNQSTLSQEVKSKVRGRDSSAGRASDWRARRNADAGLIPQCFKGFFLKCRLSVQTLLQCSYNPHEQSHASTSVHTLKMPNTGHRKRLHSLIEMGSIALAAAAPYPSKASQISCTGQWSTNELDAVRVGLTEQLFSNYF